MATNKFETVGAREKFYHRLLCIKEFLESLDAQLTALEAQREACCEPYADGITMGGTFVVMDGTDIPDDIVSMED